MRIFFNAEFTGLKQSAKLLSIGFIAENGRIFYAEFTDYDESLLDPWIKQNVMTKIWHWEKRNKTRSPPIIGMRTMNDNLANYLTDGNPIAIKGALEEWLTSFDGELEIWSDCLAYDWVLFCELWGGAMNMPECVYYIPFDICTLFKMKGIDPDISREKFANMEHKDWKHHALWDAKVIKGCYERLMEMP